MDPVLALESVDVVQMFGSAGLVVATVAAIDKARALEGRGKLLVGAVSSVLITLIWAYANPPVVWPSLPLEALVSWLTAMGVWSGGKAIAGR